MILRPRLEQDQRNIAARSRRQRGFMRQPSQSRDPRSQAKHFGPRPEIRLTVIGEAANQAKPRLGRAKCQRFQHLHPAARACQRPQMQQRHRAGGMNTRRHIAKRVIAHLHHPRFAAKRRFQPILRHHHRIGSPPHGPTHPMQQAAQHGAQQGGRPAIQPRWVMFMHIQNDARAGPPAGEQRRRPGIGFRGMDHLGPLPGRAHGKARNAKKAAQATAPRWKGADSDPRHQQGRCAR